ncbi:hypothetical protein [Promicromonospora sp. NPDC057488]|uniref:hypothetical protein n=1 Tax=Promicromonospora sp. NPDC057488 TaxID=3346147 RepID=UPI00366BECE0
MTSRNPSARQRLYEAATRWSLDRGVDNAFLVDAATDALVSGVDSPTLRELAGATAHADTEELRVLLESALQELMLPRPRGIAPSDVVADDGAVVPRTPAKTIRFEVVAADVHDDFQVLVFVDDVEMTSRAAGAGMGPDSLFFPENRLVASTEPRVVPIARCECGEYGCGATQVRILRQGDAVHWDWLHETPMDHGVTFRADQYDAAVAQVAADHSWERPQDTARRQILTAGDKERLRAEGLTLRSPYPVHDDPSTYRVALQTLDNVYQVFLHFPLDGREPTAIVPDVLRVLGEPPSSWSAQFHAISAAVKEPPAIAGRRWTRADLAWPRRRT